MVLFLEIFSCILILTSLLPLIPNQHWVFRLGDFIKVKVFALQICAFVISLFFLKESIFLCYSQSIQFVLIAYHIYLLARYTKFWRVPKVSATGFFSDKIKIISCNVYQFNTQYERFIDLIKREQPDIFLTMESNADWEKAMRVLEKDYPAFEKVTLENTYGMHFYTKLKVVKKQTHFFVADDLPSIEAELETKDGHRFLFFGVHPPPPSPTEEKNSKERDGDLLSVAKYVRNKKNPTVICGDFNNVAWAKSSILFKKTSELIDARIGRGVLSTFHTKYWFFRVPLDLLFHSPEIFIDKLFTYENIGSDHFPVGCMFHINHKDDSQKKDVKELEEGEMQEVNEMIMEGKEEESENR